MEKKESFVMYTGWYDITKHLDDVTLGKLFRAINEYQDRGEVKTALPPEAMIAFAFIKKQFEIDYQKYLNRCKVNSENGKKGGAPKGNQNAGKQPKTTETTENKQKQRDNEGEGDCVNEFDYESEGENDRLARNTIFCFQLAYKERYKTNYTKPIELSTAYELFEKLKDAISSKANGHPWELLKRYFAKMFGSYNSEYVLNEFHRKRLSIAHINEYFEEIHPIVFDLVSRINFHSLEEKENTVDAELRKMGMVPAKETPPLKEETPKDEPQPEPIPEEARKIIDEVAERLTIRH